MQPLPRMVLIQEGTWAISAEQMASKAINCLRGGWGRRDKLYLNSEIRNDLIHISNLTSRRAGNIGKHRDTWSAITLSGSLSIGHSVLLHFLPTHTESICSPPWKEITQSCSVTVIASSPRSLGGPISSSSSPDVTTLAPEAREWNIAKCLCFSL